jgi:hypothetical protein
MDTYVTHTTMSCWYHIHPMAMPYSMIIAIPTCSLLAEAGGRQCYCRITADSIVQYKYVSFEVVQ